MKLSIVKRIGLAVSSGLLLVSFSGAGIQNVGASTNHHEMSHSAGSQLGCQQKCSSATANPITQTKKEIDRQQDKKSPYAYPLAESKFTYDKVKRLAHIISSDFRLLRPPDLLVLHSVYRI